LNIRDFSEVRSIYSVKPTDANHAAANDAYRQNREQKNGIAVKDNKIGNHLLLTSLPTFDPSKEKR